MSTTLRLRIGALCALGTFAFALHVAGCSTSAPEAEPEEGGTAEEAGPPPGPPCSRLTTLCKENGTCEGAADCESALCREGLCRTIDPADGTKNGDETDVDCGGTKAPACPDDKGCLVAIDCTSGVCTGNVCRAPTATDGVQNGDETGVDCGGTTTKAPKCAPGKGCRADVDCDKVKCDLVNKKCKEPSHDDGIKNLDETGIDCGGPTASVARCKTGEGCAATTDCANVLCNTTTLVCDPPSATDGLKNGTETDIDCGGAAPTNAPKCVIDKGCLAGTDCTSGGCSVGLGNKCAPLSCATAEMAGIGSCGAKETGQAGAAHESCCKSLVLPTRTTRRLDKYEITAGRFRSFLASAGPNVRAWVAAYVAANPGSQLAQRMAAFPVLSTIYPAALRSANLSVTAHMSLDIDNYGGIRGCANYNGSYSANTYWMDYDPADFGLPKRSLARTVSDEKPLNCAMPIMFAAFCAWDGGELATQADYADAWGAARYPWGATDTLRPTYNWCNGTYRNGGFTCQCDDTNHTGDAAGAPLFGPGPNNIGPSPNARCPAGGFVTNGQKGVFYEFPLGTDKAKDNEVLIAAPGRFQSDASAAKSGGESWHDLAANLAEYTGDWNGTGQTFCDFSAAPVAGQPTCTRANKPAGSVGTQYTGIPNVGLVGDSWEGHQYGRHAANAWPATGQYGKFGGRCVRPADPY